MPSLLDLVEEQAKTSDNHCGLSLVQLQNKTGLNSAELKKQLKVLHNQKKIRVRHGINHQLIFKL